MQKTPFNKILFLFFFLYASNLYGQQDLKSFNLFGLSEYYIQGRVLGGDTYEFTIYKYVDINDKAEKGVIFTLRPFTKEAFVQNLFTSYTAFRNKIRAEDVQQLPEVVKRYDIALVDTEKTPAYKQLEAEASRLYYMFVAGSIVVDNLNDEPIAGEICYFNTINILRRDFNDQASKRRMNRLWEVYKGDKKLVKKLLKDGALDYYLDPDILKSKDPDEKLSAKSIMPGKALTSPGQESQLPAQISGQFTFLEIFRNLGRRELIQKKRNEFLHREALSRQNRYEEILNNLNESRLKLQKDTISLKRYLRTLGIVDTLKLIEIRRNDFNEKLQKVFLELEDHVQKKIIDSSGFIRGKLRTSESISGAGRVDIGSIEKELDTFEDSLWDFTDCLEGYSNNGFDREAKEKCRAQNEILNSSLENGKNIFSNLLRENEKALETVSSQLAEVRTGQSSLDADLDPLKNDSTDLARNIAIYKEIVNVYDGIPAMIDVTYKYVSIFSEYADTIAALNDQQMELINQIQLYRYKDDLRSSFVNRNDKPGFFGSIISMGASLVDLDSISVSVSDRLITQLGQIGDTIQSNIDSTKEEIKELDGKIKEEGAELARREDQLIFKEFKVDNIVMEINEGFIENILMVGKVAEFADKYGRLKVTENGKAVSATRTLKFENSSPIGFSRKLDFDALKEKKLYTRGGGRTQYEVSLEDVISIYTQEHQVGRRDYSPANQIVTFEGKGQNVSLCQKLKKDATYRLFEAKIFSDFVGLDETEPNGLIQTEVSKRINLLTSRKPFIFLNLGGLPNEWNLGLFSFLEPSVALSKVEDNNRFLTLNSKDRLINNEPSPIKFASTLSLRQFENFSAGADGNLFLLDMPNFKSTLYLNWGVRYGRTAVRDENVQGAPNGVNEFGVNTFSHHPELLWSIYEDERYGFSVSYQHHWFYLRDNRFEQVANTTFFENQVINTARESRQFNTIRFLTTLEPTTNNKGRLFFRYTYNWQQGFWRTGFHQAQVGYSFFLLGRQPTGNTPTSN